MGIGGGLILVPALIYLFGQDEKTAVGTSLFQIVINASLITVLHAWQNQSVDTLFALFLLVGGTVGSRLGVLFSQRLGGRGLRLLFGLLTLSVGLVMFFSLVIPPDDLYLIRFITNR